MSTYKLRDNRGRIQRIKAQTPFQAGIALREINAENDRQPDGGKALASSWGRTLEDFRRKARLR